MQSKKHIAEARARGDHVKHWITYTTYVDMETGEVLTKHQFKNYVKEKTERAISFNKHRTTGTIWYTIHGRRRPQLEIEYTETRK